MCCLFPVLQNYTHIGLKQNLLRLITLDIITRLLDNAVLTCMHVLDWFSKDFSELRRVEKSRVSALCRMNDNSTVRGIMKGSVILYLVT